MNPAEMPEISEPDIDRCFNKYISEKTFSAGACMASVGDRIFHRNIYGSPTLPPPNKRIDFESVFDLASLTKVLATGVAVMHLASKNRIDLGAPLSRTIPEFNHEKFNSITVDMLLDHTAGFSACVPFWENITASDAKLAPAQKTCGSQNAMAALKKQVAEMPLENPPGTTTVYSDVGFLALAWIVEGVVGKPLDVFVEQEIYRPLGLSDSLFFIRRDDFKQQQKLKKTTFVATENCPLRKKVMVGEVHDPSCWAAGGVCGHAGLFGTVDGVWELMRVLWESFQGNGGFFHSGTTRRFFTRSKRLKETTRALAWDTPSANNSTAGKRFSRISVGRLGFTGTSVWMDLKSGIIGVVLANSVHPTNEGKPETMRVFRPRVYELIAKAGESLGPDGGETPGSGEAKAVGAAAFGRR